MNRFFVALRSLLYYKQLHFALLCGVMLSGALIGGALLLGDSLRGSLRRMALARLGAVEEVLQSSSFFREKLASETQDHARPAFPSLSVAPLIILGGGVEEGEGKGRVNRVQVLGLDGRGAPHLNISLPLPQEGEAFLNEALASRLHVAEGGDIILHLQKNETIPAENPLGRKTETVENFRLKVVRILSTEAGGDFSFQYDQRPVYNLFLPLPWLQKRLDQEGRVNTLLTGRTQEETPFRQDFSIQTFFHPRWEDLGIHTAGEEKGAVYLYSDRMILEPEMEEELLRQFAPYKPQPLFTYLANSLSRGDKSIPYSTITAIDFPPDPSEENWAFLLAEASEGASASITPDPSDPKKTDDSNSRFAQPLKKGEIALNEWAARSLDAQIGDRIVLHYFDPASEKGTPEEKSAEFRVSAILSMKGAATDRYLSPVVEGMTDERTISDWNPPFPFDSKRIRPEDEAYWEEYGPAPKAFLSLADGIALWQTRWGKGTGIRMALPSNENRSSLLAAVSSSPSARFIPRFQNVRLMAEKTGSATPFGILFLLMSFLVIGSSILLTALLFLLGLDQRRREMGLLLALGWTPSQITRGMMTEGVFLALSGSLLSVPLALVYARGLIYLLNTWWVGAIQTPMLHFHSSILSLLLGALAALIGGLIPLMIALRGIKKSSPRTLLTGHSPVEMRSSGVHPRDKKRRAMFFLFWILLVILFSATFFQARQEIFFLRGILLLVGLLAFVGIRFRRHQISEVLSRPGENLWRWIRKNTSLNIRRALLTVSLAAVACFLLTATSIFHLDASKDALSKESGSGGFSLRAESTLPIYFDLNAPAEREEAGLDEPIFEKSTFFSCRISEGQDASCLNLYRVLQPRMIGVGDDLIRRGGFLFAESLDHKKWDALKTRLTDRDGIPRVPVLLDKNTANYALNLWKGVGEEFSGQTPQGEVVFVVAGLLVNSLFQGELILSEENLLRLDPDNRGKRLFLIDTPAEKSEDVRMVLDSSLGDFGWESESSLKRLQRFYEVQNTYLSSFQSLGGLGLLLGILGLGLVQIRNIWERRRELTLLQALGFSMRRLAILLFIENASLLVIGLGIGILAALTAVLPELWARQTSIPWRFLGTLFFLTFALGLLAGYLALRFSLKRSLINELKRDL